MKKVIRVHMVQWRELGARMNSVVTRRGPLRHYTANFPVQGLVSRRLLNLRLNLWGFEVIILLLNTICFKSKMYRNATN